VGQQDKAPSVQSWDVNEGYLARYKAADNVDLKDFQQRRQSAPQGPTSPADDARIELGQRLQVDAPQGATALALPVLLPPEADVGAETVAGTGGGAGGSPILFSSHAPAESVLNADPADPQGTRNVRLFHFDVEKGAAALEPQALSGAKGRISIRIDLPKEGKVFHFQRLGAKAEVACEASEADGAFLEGLLAVLCAAGAVALLRPRGK
jgi:hypothetical protein